MCSGNRLALLMMPCILLIVAPAVTPQVQSGKLTNQEFENHLLQAIESRSRGTAARLIRQNRYKTGFVVDGLLQSYLKPDAEGDSSTAEHKIEMAREIAEIYRDRFEDDFFVNRIDLYRNWTGEQKKEKLYADSIRDASADESNSHQFESALEMVQEALRIYEKLDDIETQAKCSNSIGLLSFRLTDFPEAERHLERSLEINRQIDNLRGVLANLDNLAALYKAQYKYQPALEAFNEAIALSDAIADEESRAKQWMSIGSIYQAMKKYDEALKNYNLALDYADKSHNDKLKASALLNRGALASDQSRFKEAIRDWQEGVVLARKLGNQALEGSLLANLSIAYRSISKFDSSLTMLSQALGLTRKTANRWTEGNILREIGVVMYFKGFPDSSLVYWNKAIEVFKDIPDMVMVGTVTGYIGVYFKNTGKPFEALNAYEKALKRVREVNDEREEANILGNIGNVYTDILADYAQAEDYYKKAIAIKERLGETAYVGKLLSILGVLQKNLGNYQASLHNYQRALEIARESSDRSLVAKLNGDIGSIYIELGEHEKGVQYLNRNLKMVEKTGERKTKAGILLNLGAAYAEMDMDSLALEFFRKAEILATEQSQSGLAIDILLNRGSVREKQGSFGQAMQAYQTAFRTAVEISQVRAQLQALRAMAKLNVSLNKSELALTNYEDALQIAHKILAPEDIWRTQFGLATLLEKQGKKQHAVDMYAAAIDSIESLRARFSVESLKQSFMEEKLEIYHAIVNLLLELGRQNEAFAYLQRAKARNLFEILSADRINITQGISQESLERKKELEFRLRDIQELLAKASGADEPVSEDIAALQDSLKNVRFDYEELLQEIKLDHPGYAQLTGNIEPLTLPEIQERILSPNDVLIEYFLTEEKTFAFVVRPDTLISVALELSEPEVRAAVDTLLQDLREIGSPASRGRAVRNFADMQFNLKTAHRLYQQLFEPIERYIPEKRNLTIIPDGVLHYLPFEALVVQVDKGVPWYQSMWRSVLRSDPPLFHEYTRAEYLVEKYAISYAPSASVLDPKILQSRHREPPAENLAIFASPDFSGASQEQFASLETADISGLKEFVYMGSDNTWSFMPLQRTEQLAKELGRNVQPSQLFLGMQATEDAFKKSAGRYRYVHIATHAVAEERMPMYSRIVFAQDDNPAEDGFLQTYEILNMQLDADVVTLVGCQTGLGRLRKGEGIIGLTRAFMYAGAPSVAVSLWSVEESSGRVINQFYGNLQNGMNKADALQRAKLQFMGSTGDLAGGKKFSNAHPFLWAPFVLVGNRQ